MDIKIEKLMKSYQKTKQQCVESIHEGSKTILKFLSTQFADNFISNTTLVNKTTYNKRKNDKNDKNVQPSKKKQKHHHNKQTNHNKQKNDQKQSKNHDGQIMDALLAPLVGHQHNQPRDQQHNDCSHTDTQTPHNVQTTTG